MPPHSKHLKAVMLAIERRGFRIDRVTHTRSNHYKLQIRGLGLLTVSKTPSDRRALNNALSDLRKLERNR